MAVDPFVELAEPVRTQFLTTVAGESKLRQPVRQLFPVS
jgi:hypothetical protein